MLDNTPAQVYIFIGALLALGLTLAWMGFRRLFNRRLMVGGTTTITGLFFLSFAFIAIGVLANLYTYQRLTAEQMVATLSFKQYAEQEFIVTLTPYGSKKRKFNVYGDECQLDARILKWHGIANLLGLETLYRLERLGGRYSDTHTEQTAQRSVYGLSERAGVELWELVNQFNDWIPWIDASYGNVVYVPMQSGAEFRVSISNSGLIARPNNSTAKQAIKNWK